MADLKISQLPTFTPPLQNTDLFPASQFIGTPGAQTNKVPWGSILSQIQASTFPSLTVSGLTGATAGTRYVGSTTSGSPISGTFIAGDFIVDKSGSMWVCTVGGSPGTWNEVGGLPVNQWTASGSFLRPTATGTINGIQLFPLTPSTGSLKLLSTSNSGNTDTIITNAAMGQASTITLKDPGVSSSSFILADSPVNQSITSTGTAPGVSFIGQNNWNVYGQIEARDIADLNYHITYGVSASNNAASIFAGHAGVGYIPLYLGAPGGSFVGIGSNGFQTGFKLFPAGSNLGTLQLSAVNSSGNFDMVISNASLGQTSTISIPDPGSSTANFILSKSSSSQTITSDLFVTGKFYAGFSSPSVYTQEMQVANSMIVANGLDASEQLIVAYDSVTAVSFIQSIHQGISARPIVFQPSGGNFGIGVPNSHIFSKVMDVGVTSSFNDTVFIQNGMNVAKAGGGIQFNNTGAMTVDTGVSFFTGDQYYRIGFEDFSATRGWIRQNVDTADAIHGFIWSAGVVSSPINGLMLLQGDGKLLLGPSIQSSTAQSLANIFGDVYLSNQATPSIPTGGGKLYSKLVSGNSDLYFLDSSGTEHQLTSTGPGLVTSVFGRTGDVVGVNTDYATVSNFTTTSQIIQKDDTNPQLLIRGLSDTDKKLALGMNTTSNVGFIQAYTSGPTPTELKLNPFSGPVSIGLLPTSASPSTLYVGGDFQVQKDGTFVGNTPQIRIKGALDANKELQIGYDTTNNESFIQSIQQGTGVTPLFIQPAAGSLTSIGGNIPAATLHVTGPNSSTIVCAATSSVSSANMFTGDVNITRTDPGGVGPFLLNFRVLCSDGNIHTASLTLT